MGKILELLDRARCTGLFSDRQAFLEALYEETYTLVLSITRRYFPFRKKDLANDIFAFKVMPLPLEDFQEARDSLGGFVKTIAVHYCVDVYRKGQREKDILASGAKQWFRNDREYRRMQEGRLDPWFLARYLTPLQLQVVLLRFNEDLEFSEIRRRLGLPSEDAVRQHLSRAGKKLVPVYSTCIH